MASIMEQIAALESATMPEGLVSTAIADAQAMVATLDQISTEIVDFQELVNGVLGDHPARHEVSAPAEEARGWAWESRDYVANVVDDLNRIPGLLQAALQRRDALLVTLRA